jgi:hypothetical protein
METLNRSLYGNQSQFMDALEGRVRAGERTGVICENVECFSHSLCMLQIKRMYIYIYMGC